MFVVSAVASVLFLGGYLAPLPALQQLGPVPLGWFWLLLKAWGLVFVMMWLRWTLPRARVDQLMHIAWKVLLPISLALVRDRRRPGAPARDEGRLLVGPLGRLADHAAASSASCSW